MTELEIYRLKEMAMGLDTGKRHLIMNAIDAIENLQAHLEHRDRDLEQARGERDAVTKRMIQLEIQNGNMLSDFKASMLSDPCDYCKHCLTSNNRCEESDLDCETCRHEDCVCKHCEDCDKWAWRGMEE